MQNEDTSKGRNRDGGIHRFEDLMAWQEARALTREVYSVSNTSPLKQDSGLRDQLRRAAVSVMSNIAEGFERMGAGEKAHFMNIARASGAEVKSLLYVCLDIQHLNPHQVSDLQTRCTRISRLTSGLIRSVSAPRRKSESELESGRKPGSESESGRKRAAGLGRDRESGRSQQSPIQIPTTDSTAVPDSYSDSDSHSNPDSDSEP
jgi:four helix bundle protein